MYPFSVSVDRHENPVKIFTDPRDKKEYILDYKTEKDRLSQLKKINKIISSYNDEAVSNNKEYLKMIPPDGKVHSATEIGFHKPLNTIPEIPSWGFCFYTSLSKLSFLIIVWHYYANKGHTFKGHKPNSIYLIENEF